MKSCFVPSKKRPSGMVISPTGSGSLRKLKHSSKTSFADWVSDVQVRYLTLEDLLGIADDIRVGPVRDIGLLDSAAQRPSSTLWGAQAYESIPLKAAALLESLTRNHPLVDGNKRLGFVATVVFLRMNDFSFEPPSDDDVYDFVISVASGRTELADAADIIARWSQSPE